jgi:hypothetical protein
LLEEAEAGVVGAYRLAEHLAVMIVLSRIMVVVVVAGVLLAIQLLPEALQVAMMAFQVPVAMLVDQEHIILRDLVGPRHYMLLEETVGLGVQQGRMAALVIIQQV